MHKRIVAPGVVFLGIILALNLASCGSSQNAPEFQPYLGTGGIVSAKEDAQKHKLVLETSAVNIFSNIHDSDPDSQNVYKKMWVSFAGETAQGTYVKGTTNLRGHGADTSYSDDSAWINYWKTVLPAPQSLRDGQYLVIMSACSDPIGDCERSLVPVCVRNNQIIGEPTGNGTNNVETYQYGKPSDDGSGHIQSPDLNAWLSNTNCNHPIMNGTYLGAQYANGLQYVQQELPDDWTVSLK